MVNFTSNMYQMKQEILSFSNKISKNLKKPERKFVADMNYGILASRSCLLTNIADQLHEPSKKINSVAIADRLGHEKVETTLNTYSHLFPHVRDEVAEKLQNCF